MFDNLPDLEIPSYFFKHTWQKDVCKKLDYFKEIGIVNAKDRQLYLNLILHEDDMYMDLGLAAINALDKLLLYEGIYGITRQNRERFSKGLTG